MLYTMKDLRVSRLIISLNEVEIDIVLSILKENKQKTYLLLFTAIEQLKTTSLTKEEIYLRVYKKKWSTKLDANFRTDLSRLADFIENCLVEDRLQKRILTDRKLRAEEKLNLFADLKLAKELEKEYEQSLAAYSYDSMFQNQLTEKFANYIIKSANNISERNALMERVHHNYTAQSHQQQNIMNAKRHYYKCIQNYYFKQINGNYLEEINFETHKDIFENEDVLEAKYYYLLGIANLRLDVSFNENELVYYHQLENIALQLLQQSTTFQPQFARAYHIIATRYSILGDFVKANLYYQELLDKTPQKHWMNYSISILNYITNLSKLKQFDKALEYLKLLEYESKKDEKLKSDYTIRLLSCYLFMNNAPAILTTIANVDYNSLQPFEKIYYRLCQCNAYLMQKEFELAYNEINNLLRSKLMQEIDADYLPVTELISFLINAIFKNGKLKLTTAQLHQFELLRLKHDTIQFPYLKHYSPYLWLKQQLSLL